ncbi:HEAT repeat-containing protein 3 [Pectinophora gossypiella]|uniref:HEAT repeat-containing protein 3 n=1 Tax=Pectinophora gossypiella TaxID=13191 RepID=UPI00214EC7E2|nr:HEAT repeat-containing protein 3 [Pectinophora gossypiella]XP_049876856.1 HEAT repeat-containing protein 3 [Pectinophora gossypiella]
MGKIRKPRPNRTKRNVEPDVSDEEEQIPVDSKENAIQTILDQLQAANVEEKYCGLQTFALMIESPDNIEEVLSRGVVKVVAPLLLDPASSVRNAAAGALRNLSTVRPEVCDAMMEQDVMTSLTMFFHEHAESWTPDQSSKTNQDDVETIIQIINLLLNLCESSELAIKYLGQSKILDILPRYLDIPTFGAEIVIAALQCLFVVIEDNPVAMEKIKTNSEKQLQVLLALEDSDPSALLIKTLAAGVIINTCGGNIASLPVTVIHQIISILAATLTVDHRMVCNQLTSSLPLADDAGKVEAPKGKEAQVIESQIKSVSQMLDAQQCSIEIIANICSCDDSDSENGGDSSDSEEIGDDDIPNEAGLTTPAEDRLPPEVLEALISMEIFAKVWARTQLPAENVMLILKEYHGSKSIHKKLHTLQSGALLCINNMLSTLPIENLGGVNGVYKIWVDAGKLVFKQNSDNLILMESATAVMRAALDKIKFRENGNTSGHGLFNELALTDIEIMLAGIRDCQVPEIRSNLIRMIGIMALLLVNTLNDTTSEVICTITEFILDQAHKENVVWVLAEAVDTIVDLYSEDETDGLAAKVKLVEKLTVLAPLLKNKARQQKKLPKEYKVLVSTATSNLPRFIKYKKERISKLK